MNFKYTTDRLELRVLTADAAPQVLEFYKNNKERFEASEPINGENFYTLEHQSALLGYEYQQILRFAMLRLWIFSKKEPEQILGTICFHEIRRPIFESCVVGYKMDLNACGNGFCREALTAGIEIVFEELNLHRIEAYVIPDNNISIHLLESLGFAREGLIHEKVKIQGYWKDHYLYSLLRK